MSKSDHFTSNTPKDQSCLEPETLSVGHFFPQKVILFEYLDPVNCNHRYYVKLDKFFTKNAITFDLTDRKKTQNISLT